MSEGITLPSERLPKQRILTWEGTTESWAQDWACPNPVSAIHAHSWLGTELSLYSPWGPPRLLGSPCVPLAPSVASFLSGLSRTYRARAVRNLPSLEAAPP